MTQNLYLEAGVIVNLPSFDPSGRSDFRVVEIKANGQGTYVYLRPVSPDGHYVSDSIGVRTLGDVLALGRVA